MGQDIEVMALRLSGQLLLGVVRIYSRKAKYLLDEHELRASLHPPLASQILSESQRRSKCRSLTLQAN